MRILLLMFFSVGLLNSARGQAICGIWFDYDAAGNRIKRYYDCKDVDPNGGIVGYFGSGYKLVANKEKQLMPTVSPNPTKGPYTIALPSDSGRVHFHWYDAKGSIIASGGFNEATYTGSIDAFPPGNYMLAIRWGSRTYTYQIVKHN